MKKILLFTFLVSALASFGQGLISSYPFNGNANDENGTNNGTVYGAILTDDRFGNSNSAYSFDGVDDYISSANNIFSNSDLNNGSVGIWFKTDMTVPTNTILFSYEGWVNIEMNNSGLITACTDGVCTDASSSISYNDGQWHFAVVTWTSNVVTKLYIDGVLIDQVTPTQSPTPDLTDRPLTIGNHPGLTNDYFKGTLDDVSVYNNALTQSEIDSLKNVGICYQSVTVTDTLVINYTITGYNPIEYANKIKVYPNPTSNLITIDSDNNSFGNTIKIINSASQEVYNGTINSNQEILDLSTWTGAGIYFLHLYDDKGNLIDIKKIVLQ
tara:strand:+ start:917 stop:1897 length:981 start_codon:yes stop_codon:yes gene_type:complete